MSFGFGPGTAPGPMVHMHRFQESTGKVFDWKITRRLLTYLAPHKKQSCLNW